jgi:hypothetical protein
MLAEVCWDSATAFAGPDAANRYLQWWAREYFGEAAASDAAQSYRGYYQRLSSWDQISVGADAVLRAVAALDAKFDGKPFTPIASDVAVSLEQRSQAYQALFQTTASASAKMTPDRQQFFYEHVSFPLLIDWRQRKRPSR